MITNTTIQDHITIPELKAYRELELKRYDKSSIQSGCIKEFLDQLSALQLGLENTNKLDTI